MWPDLKKKLRPDAYVTDPCPGHQLEDVTVQLFGRENVPDPTPTGPNSYGRAVLKVLH